MVIYR